MQDESEWIVVPDCHEAIISTEDFERAQSAILGEKESYTRTKKDYLLRSLVRCGVCGRVMQRCPGRKKRPFYKCEKNRFVETSPCPLGERFYEDDLERIVIASLSQLLQTVIDEDKRIQGAAAKTIGSAEQLKRSILRIDQSIRQNQTRKIKILGR